MFRIILFLVLLACYPLQGQTLEVEKFKFKGLSFRSTKEEIIKTLGQPRKIFEPNFECGFLSSEEQGKPFYALDYGNIRFVGNEEDGYIVDEYQFTYGMSFTYNGVRLDMDTGLDKLIEVFGMELFGSFHDSSTDSKLVRFSDSDDGFMFYLKEGRLSMLSYWSPC